MEDFGRKYYAIEKVKEAVMDHEKTIANRPTPPKEYAQQKVKVVVLGNSGVGKTSIIYKHQYGAGFSAVNATIGASFVSHKVQASGCDQPLNLQVWDTAGQERFRCMVPMYLRNADAALIVYDITCRASFENVTKWAKELERACGTNETTVYLIGNKLDLEEKRQVSRAEGIAKAAKLNAHFVEVSSTQPICFDKLLCRIADDVARKRDRMDVRHIEEWQLEQKKIRLSSEKIPELEVVKRRCCNLF